MPNTITLGGIVKLKNDLVFSSEGILHFGLLVKGRNHITYEKGVGITLKVFKYGRYPELIFDAIIPYPEDKVEEFMTEIHNRFNQNKIVYKLPDYITLTLCNMKGCNAVAHKKGLCKKHYMEIIS